MDRAKIPTPNGFIALSSPNHNIAETELALRARKRITRHVVPYLMLVYLLAYVDRANLSIAKLQMQTELGFTDEVIGFGAGIFFLGYIILEVPGSLIVERWSARKWIARIMVSWGIIAALFGFIGTRLFGHIPLLTQFYGMRFLLGAAEAGFFPGVIVYLSHWFRAEDRTRAKAYFMMTQPLALLVSVPFSNWLMETVHTPGLAGWRWLFIIEGLPSVIMGVVTLFYLKDRPRDAAWLPDDEKAWLVRQLDAERERKAKTGKVRARDLLRQPQVILMTVIYVLIVGANQGFVFFFPSLVQTHPGISLNWRTLILAIPYLFGSIGIFIVGASAARHREQRWHTAGPMLLNGLAIALLIAAGDNLPLTLVSYALIGLTLLAYLPSFWTLPTLMLGGSAAAIAVGTINSVGNLGGFAGPSIFGYLRTATGSYTASLWILVGITMVAGLLSLAIRPPQHARQETLGEVVEDVL